MKNLNTNKVIDLNKYKSNNSIDYSIYNDYNKNWNNTTGYSDTVFYENTWNNNYPWFGVTPPPTYDQYIETRTTNNSYVHETKTSDYQQININKSEDEIKESQLRNLYIENKKLIRENENLKKKISALKDFIINTL